MAEQGSEDGNGGGNDQQPPHLLNLKHLSPAYDLNINSRETPEDANYRRRKDFVFFIFSLLGVSITFAISIRLITSSGTPAEKENGFKLLSLIVGAFMGFLVGKKK